MPIAGLEELNNRVKSLERRTFADKINTATGHIQGGSKLSHLGTLSAGQTAYDTGTGFWIEYNGGTPRLSIGNSAGNKVTWDGTTLSITGTLTATLGAIGGWTIGTTALTAGSGANTVGLDSGGTNPALYAGSATPGSAPFRVTKAGALTASSGAVGGWTLGASTLVGGNVTLDSAGIIKINYSAGLAGAQIDNNGNAEFNNIIARGSIITAVFQKSLVTAFAGSQVTAKSAAVLAADCTATGTTFPISVGAQASAAPFASGDRIRFSDGTNTTWSTVGAASGSGPYTYTATWQSGSTSATYKTGQAVVDYIGSAGGGWVAISADDANGPFVSIQSSAASPWSDAVERVRVGNLRNAFGVGANNRYGFGVGDFSGGNYLMYNPTDGFTLKAGAGGVSIDVNGITFENAVTYLQFKDTGGSVATGLSISYDNSDDLSISNKHPTGEIQLRLKTTATAQVTTTWREDPAQAERVQFFIGTGTQGAKFGIANGGAGGDTTIQTAGSGGGVNAAYFPGAVNVGTGTSTTAGTLTVSGSATISTGLNVGSATGAGTGVVLASGNADFGIAGTTDGLLARGLGQDGSMAFRNDHTHGLVFIDVRPNSGGSGWVSYTESGVADRWKLGIKPADAKMYWLTGSFGATTDQMSLASGPTLNLIGSSGALQVNATQVVKARQTGWTAPSATLSRTAVANADSLATTISHLAALITDLTTHGLIGA